MKLLLLAQVAPMDPIVKFFEQDPRFSVRGGVGDSYMISVSGYAVSYILFYNKFTKTFRIVNNFIRTPDKFGGLLFHQLFDLLVELSKEVVTDSTKLPEFADTFMGLVEYVGEQAGNSKKASLDPILDRFTQDGRFSIKFIEYGSYHLIYPDPYDREDLSYYLSYYSPIMRLHLVQNKIIKLGLLKQQLLEQMEELIDKINIGELSTISELMDMYIAFSGLS